MPFGKILLLVLLMACAVSSWADSPSSFIYKTYDGQSFLIDFARVGSSTASDGTVTTAPGTYYADYLSGWLLNTGIQENNYAYNVLYPEGNTGIVSVSSSVAFTSVGNSTVPIQQWGVGTQLGYFNNSFDYYTGIAQKTSTVPLVNGWVLFVSGLMTLYYAGVKKRSTQSRFSAAS